MLFNIYVFSFNPKYVDDKTCLNNCRINISIIITNITIPTQGQPDTQPKQTIEYSIVYLYIHKSPCHLCAKLGSKSWNHNKAKVINQGVKN